MSGKNIFTILERNNLSCCGINYRLYEEFSKKLDNEQDIIEKINEYNDYIESAVNKYSEDIMQFLRQREGLNKFDFSKDAELNVLSSNEAFEEVLKWKLGGYSDTIKDWVKDIYGVDLNDIDKVNA